MSLSVNDLTHIIRSSRETIQLTRERAEREEKRAEETMYQRIKRMTPEEMRQFVYWVYLCGNRDGSKNIEDSPSGYFGGHMLTLPAKQVMPDDNVNDLWDSFKEIFDL